MGTVYKQESLQMATMQDFPTTIGQLKHCTTGLVLSPKAAQII